MDINEKKLELIRWVATIEDEETVKHLKDIKSEYLRENGCQTVKALESELEAIDEGLADCTAGRTRPFEEFEKEMRTWLTQNKTPKPS